MLFDYYSIDELQEITFMGYEIWILNINHSSK